MSVESLSIDTLGNTTVTEPMPHWWNYCSFNVFTVLWTGCWHSPPENINVKSCCKCKPNIFNSLSFTSKACNWKKTWVDFHRKSQGMQCVCRGVRHSRQMFMKNVSTKQAVDSRARQSCSQNKVNYCPTSLFKQEKFGNLPLGILWPFVLDVTVGNHRYRHIIQRWLPL